MALTTSILTGRVVLPTDIAPAHAELMFTLSGLDSEGGDILPPGDPARCVLIDGELPPGYAIWRNTEGYAGTHYIVTVIWTDMTRHGIRETTRELGKIQVGDDASYVLADLLMAGTIPAENTFWNVLTEAEYQAAIDAVAKSQAWAESPTPPNPGDPTSKSSKTWAGEAQSSAAEALGYRNETLAATPFMRDSFSALIAITGAGGIPVGAKVRVPGVGLYRRAADGATDSNLTHTASTLKWYVEYNEDGYRSITSYGPITGVNDTAVFNAAMGSLRKGDRLHFPMRTYAIWRGNGAFSSANNNILYDNIKITGDGEDYTQIVGYNAAGAIPNNVSNKEYNIFQAEDRKKIRISGVGLSGYCALLAAYRCTDVRVREFETDGYLGNAGQYLRDQAVYMYSCKRGSVRESTFFNCFFGVYLTGTALAQTDSVDCADNHFEITRAAGTYIATFPVGVYWVYTTRCHVRGNTFKNIYSSVDNGTVGTGMGFGFYEGDGVAAGGSVVDNTFIFEDYGLKRAQGIYVTHATDTIISTNLFEMSAGAKALAMRVQASISDFRFSITNNVIRDQSSFTGAFGIYIIGDVLSANVMEGLVTGNIVTGGQCALRITSGGAGKYLAEANVFSGQIGPNILIEGEAAMPHKSVSIIGNKLSKAGTNGVLFNAYVISPILRDNEIIDGNLTNVAGDAGAAVFFTSNSYGLIASGNTIKNTPYGGGLFTFGFQNAALVANRIFKDILGDNTFEGIPGNSPYGRFWTGSPTNGIFDMTKGDFVKNVQLSAAGTPGWHCVQKIAVGLTADASSASTTVTVSSTGGFAAGDIVLLCKTANPYAGGYAVTTDWHTDTIASVTDGTHFVLTTGIPAGDSTYLSGTAVCHTARFKAAAAIAA